jgi:hypothetical protein
MRTLVAVEAIPERTAGMTFEVLEMRDYAIAAGLVRAHFAAAFAAGFYTRRIER